MYNISNNQAPKYTIESTAVSWIHKFVHSYSSLSKAEALLNCHIKNCCIQLDLSAGLCRAEYVEKESLTLYGVYGEILLTVKP